MLFKCFWGMFVVMLLSMNNQVRGQDPYFSMFFANPVHLNPAFTGISQGTTVTANQREQWRGIPKGNLGGSPTGYRTTSLTGEYGKPCALQTRRVSLGGGLTLFRDGAGQAPLVTLGAGVAGSFAYRLISRRRGWSTEARLGWQASFMQKKLSGDYFIHSDQLSPYYGLITPPTILDQSSGGFFNHNAGVMLRFFNGSFQNFSVGVSASNLFTPNQSLYDRMGDTVLLPRRMTFYFGGNFGNDGLYFTPQVRWDRQASGKLNMFTAGAYIQGHRWYGGVFLNTSFRHFNGTNGGSANPSKGGPTVNVSTGIDVYDYWPGLERLTKKGQRLILGFSYDIGLANLKAGNTLGALEVNLRLNFFDTAKGCSGRIDMRRCPVFGHNNPL